jgi:hypothetical protein
MCQQIPVIQLSPVQSLLVPSLVINPDTRQDGNKITPKKLLKYYLRMFGAFAF